MTAKESLEALRKVVIEVKRIGFYVFLKGDHDVIRAIELCQLAGARTKDIDKTIENAYFEDWTGG